MAKVTNNTPPATFTLELSEIEARAVFLVLGAVVSCNNPVGMAADAVYDVLSEHFEHDDNDPVSGNVKFVER